MRGDTPAIAIRLTEQLREEGKVHEHRQSGRTDNRGANVRENHWNSVSARLERTRKNQEAGRKSGGHTRGGLTVYGIRYASIREAKAALSCARETIYKLLDTGQARYTKERK